MEWLGYLVLFFSSLGVLLLAVGCTTTTHGEDVVMTSPSDFDRQRALRAADAGDERATDASVTAVIDGGLDREEDPGP